MVKVRREEKYGVGDSNVATRVLSSKAFTPTWSGSVISPEL